MPQNSLDDARGGDLFIEEDDPSDAAEAQAEEIAPWRILIVDDDVDVHVVTKFALSNTNFQGRRLSFLHAYSAQEAFAILRDTPGIALILLDVIMETSDAGLRLARQVRDELHNALVRIVLRTGQPGQALEHSIIVDYDINDFWCKADLTTRKLFTTVISSLRSYATLAEAAAQHQALSAELVSAQQVKAVVEQHALVLTLDARGRILEANELACRLAGSAREALQGRDLHAAHPASFPQPITGAILAALEHDNGWAGDIRTTSPTGELLVLRCAVLSFRDTDGVPYQYVAVATIIMPCS